MSIPRVCPTLCAHTFLRAWSLAPTFIPLPSPCRLAPVQTNASDIGLPSGNDDISRPRPASNRSCALARRFRERRFVGEAEASLTQRLPLTPFNTLATDIDLSKAPSSFASPNPFSRLGYRPAFCITTCARSDDYRGADGSWVDVTAMGPTWGHAQAQILVAPSVAPQLLTLEQNPVARPTGTVTCTVRSESKDEFRFYVTHSRRGCRRWKGLEECYD
ncbi:hypothetical protein V8E53_000102 [Lactarius tabidus]